MLLLTAVVVVVVVVVVVLLTLTLPLLPLLPLVVVVVVCWSAARCCCCCATISVTASCDLCRILWWANCRLMARMQYELNGDTNLAAKIVSDTIDRHSLDNVRWTRTLDTKLRTACAGVRVVCCRLHMITFHCQCCGISRLIVHGELCAFQHPMRWHTLTCPTMPHDAGGEAGLGGSVEIRASECTCMPKAMAVLGWRSTHESTAQAEQAQAELIIAAATRSTYWHRMNGKCLNTLM